MRTVIASAILAMVLCGCGSLPFEIQRKSSVESAEGLSAKQSNAAQQSFRGHMAPVPEVKVDGKENQVHLTIPPLLREVDAKWDSGLDSKASSLMSWTEDYSRYLPMGVSIILVGIGLLILWFAFGKIKKSSASARAAFGLADGTMASVINSLRKRASSDPTILADIADMEKARGKMRAEEP